MPLVCDCSGSLLTTPIDVSKYGVLVAEEQNIGGSGNAITIARKDFIGNHQKETPTMCNWKEFLDSPSRLLQTPNCWSIYMTGLAAAHYNKIGGVKAI